MTDQGVPDITELPSRGLGKILRFAFPAGPEASRGASYEVEPTGGNNFRVHRVKNGMVVLDGHDPDHTVDRLLENLVVVGRGGLGAEVDPERGAGIIHLPFNRKDRLWRCRVAYQRGAGSTYLGDATTHETRQAALEHAVGRFVAWVWSPDPQRFWKVSWRQAYREERERQGAPALRLVSEGQG